MFIEYKCYTVYGIVIRIDFIFHGMIEFRSDMYPDKRVCVCVCARKQFWAPVKIIGDSDGSNHHYYDYRLAHGRTAYAAHFGNVC